jgi:hypothetical protein
MNMKSTYSKSTAYWIITALFVITKLSLHFFTSTNYELHRDEMLYFNMSDHLSAGYATVPPLTGFLAYIAKTIFGYSVFGIRLIPAILGALSLYLISKIIRELGGGLVALLIAGTSFLLSPGFLLLNTLFTPNAAEQFLWLLLTYFIFRMVKLYKPELWIVIGILAGISFMNKYSVFIFIAGFFAALLLSEHRKLLRSRYMYYAIAITLIIFLPNIIWQWRTGWPVVFHMSELKRTQLVNLTFANYFADILSLNLASTLVWLFGPVSLLFFRKEREYRYIGIGSLIIILLFLFLKGKGYYMMGLIPFLFAFGGYALEKYIKIGFAAINYGIIIFITSVSLIALPSGLPVLPFDKYSRYLEKTSHFLIYPFYRWEDGKIHNISQAYSDMIGWRELTGYVAETYNKLSVEDKKCCTIYGNRNYGYAGAVNFYGKEYNLPDAITFHESYVFWAPDTIPKGPLIYISMEKNDLDDLFSDVKETGCVRNEYFREKGLKVYLCRSPKKNIQEIYRNLAITEKSIYHKSRANN